MKIRWLLCGLLVLAICIGLWISRGKQQSTSLGKNAHSLTSEILTYGPRPPQSKALADVKFHLAKKLEAAGWSVRLQKFERSTPIGKIKFSNLRARFKPSSEKPWDRQVKGLLCAHIDSKLFKDREFLGADDAASACAAIVVIAKFLAENHPDQAAQLELVLFDGEEAFAENMTALDGLYGSRFYANQWRTRNDKPEFGILLYMIGHQNLAISIPSDSPKALAQLMFKIAEKQSVSKHFNTARGSILDDHWPLNLVGIPTLDIIGDFANKHWWHTPGDNETIISAESLGISIRVTLGMLKELLQKP